MTGASHCSLRLQDGPEDPRLLQVLFFGMPPDEGPWGGPRRGPQTQGAELRGRVLEQPELPSPAPPSSNGSPEPTRVCITLLGASSGNT